MFIPFSLIVILSWIASPSCIKLLISPSYNNFKRLSSKTKWLLTFDFEFILGFWSNNAGITCIALSVIVFNDKSWIQSFKRRIISFPRRTTWHHQQVSLPTYDLFICIIQIFFEYCFTDFVPEVSFMIPISDGVVAVTVVIILSYVVTVINLSIRIDIIFPAYPSAKTQILY